MNLLEPLRRAGHGLAQAIRRIAATVKRWAHALTGAVHAAASRHRDRIADDPGYTRTVATAVSELAVTLLPRPTVATAVAILLTGIFSPDPSPAPAHHPVSRQTAVFDEDPYEPYPATRRPTSPSTSPWDHYNT